MFLTICGQGLPEKDAQLLNSLSNDQIQQIAGMDENDIGRFFEGTKYASEKTDFTQARTE